MGGSFIGNPYSEENEEFEELDITIQEEFFQVDEEELEAAYNQRWVDDLNNSPPESEIDDSDYDVDDEDQFLSTSEEEIDYQEASALLSEDNADYDEINSPLDIKASESASD